jgi:hypothetical protein
MKLIYFAVYVRTANSCVDQTFNGRLKGSPDLFVLSGEQGNWKSLQAGLAYVPLLSCRQGSHIFPGHSNGVIRILGTIMRDAHTITNDSSSGTKTEEQQ